VGVYNLLECFKEYSKKNKSKLIHISTDEVYGDVLTGRSSETYPYKPSSPYAASKAASDHLVSSYVRTYGISAIVTNCSNNYGPKQHPEKLIPKLIYNILNNKPLPIYGKGKNSREWIYVKDHCEALLKIYLKGKNGQTYNIGTKQNFKNIDLIKKIISIAKKNNYYSNKSKIIYIKDRPGHDLRYALNSSKMNSKLKWKPKVKINEGLGNTLDWYKNNIEFYKFIRNKNFKERLGKKR